MLCSVFKLDTGIVIGWNINKDILSAMVRDLVVVQNISWINNNDNSFVIFY